MNLFDDIRPYRDEEVQPTIRRLLADNEFIDVTARFRFPDYPNWLLKGLRPLIRTFLRNKTGSIHSVHDLQLYLENYVRHVLDESTSSLTFSGEENLVSNQAHLFISNHRDIVVDPMVVNWTLYHHGHKTLHVAIGDNLLTKPFVADLMRLNKCFIVNRSAKGPREKLKAAKRLSAYIHHSITEERANIWIAQREGRAKDGIDRTNSAVIGMLTLNKPKQVPLADYVGALHIVPIAISYEWDPCDIHKAHELFVQKTGGNYEKEEHEDAASIARGITGYKGRVHIAFGKPLTDCYQSIDDMVAEIDRQIISNYVLQPSNCIAYKELHGELPEGASVTDQHIPFTESEFVKEVKQFREHVAECDERYREILLSMYANPIVSQSS